MDRVVRRYGEPHRRYHTWSHIEACFEARDQLTNATIPEIDLALLFHDAIYAPLAHDNEEQSAELLVDEGRRAWLPEPLLQGARPLVLATKHRGSCDTEEACIVVDADLSILGADEETFERYEHDVREEYAEVEDSLYVAGRARVLRDFIARPSIYQTAPAKRLWEARARGNLERSLARLQAAVTSRTSS
jgi:predicted metal-dependent HD superfamily phosphohydrolase